MATVITDNVAWDDSRKVTVDGEKFDLDIEIDYTDCPREELIKRAFKNDVVHHQNGSLRKLDYEALKEVTSSPIKIRWSQVGQKPMTKAEARQAYEDAVRALRAAGMTDEQITAMHQNQ